MGGVTASPPDRPLIAWYPGNTAPAGYIKANGALLDRTVYAWLFGKIGTTFGAGDGVTTFGIPDLRGEFIRGLDDGRGIDTGRSIGSSQTGSVEIHDHRITSGAIVDQTQVSGGGTTVGYAARSGMTDSNIRTGGTGGTETRPRNIAMLACIAYAP